MTTSRISWESFPDIEATRRVLADPIKESSASGSNKEKPPVPYQFTRSVMESLYRILMPNVVTDEGSGTDPTNYDAASVSDLRAIAYFSWHNERKLFITRRVFPIYFDFFSLSYVDEGWGALGELLQDMERADFKERRFTKVANVFANHRFLPFLKEAHRLDYKAAFVVPFFKPPVANRAMKLAKANLQGAMVFYLATDTALPPGKNVAFRQKIAAFSSAFSELVCLNEEKIQTPVRRTKDVLKDNTWNYWAAAKRRHQGHARGKTVDQDVSEDASGLVFAELRLGIIGDKEKVALGVQSALSGGDFVCLRDTTSTACPTDLCFWVTCLMNGKGPDKGSEDAFADKLRRSIAQAVANACANEDKLQLEVKIHGRHLSKGSQP